MFSAAAGPQPLPSAVKMPGFPAMRPATAGMLDPAEFRTTTGTAATLKPFIFTNEEGTCALICPGDMNAIGDGTPSMVTETPSRLNGSGELADNSRVAKFFPKIVIIPPGDTGELHEAAFTTPMVAISGPCANKQENNARLRRIAELQLRGFIEYRS